MQLNPPKKPEDYFPWLKSKSEKHWESIRINSGIFGYQIQKNTKWNPGLNHADIEKYERDLRFKFPDIYKLFLKTMNGTDKDAVNVYAETGEPYAYAPAYYSYPKDLEKVKKMIEWICESFNIDINDIDGEKIPFIIPIIGHRFLIAGKSEEHPILSMYGDDVIPYSPSLQDFLTSNIFNEYLQEGNIAYPSVDFWLK